jgi:steroid delta-isomerase-like uncharacterized protein
MMERRDLFAGLLTGGLALSLTRATAEEARDGRRLAEAFAAALTAHDMAAFADLFDEGYEQHQPIAAAAAALPNGLTAKQGVVRYFTARVTAIPDLKVIADPVVANGDWAAANFIYSGTHKGEYFGVPASGRLVTFNSTDVFRIRNGRFAAHWGAVDLAGLLRQMKGA